MKRLLLLLRIIVPIGLLAFVISKPAQTKQPSALTSQQLSRIPANVNGIPSVWPIYQSYLSGFVIRHPVDVKSESTTEGDLLYKLGETQSVGTELYDGISVLISSGRMDGKNFKELVESRHAIDKKEPTTTTISDITSVRIAGKEGFSYTVSSLSKRQIIYLPKGNNEFLKIINSTIEPQNQTRDFQKIVDLMLSSLEFPKDKQTVQPIIEQ